MVLKYVQHEKIKLQTHPGFNERWLQETIVDDPTILGLGELRVIDSERTVTGGGRLDLLLFDDDNNRRYEVELMLGATDPSHIIRTIEYWDIERRRYPAYEHVAVLIAEDVTSRFLNVMSLMSGSIPLIAIQLDALKIGDQIILNFVTVLDQTDLRSDDTDDTDSGGGEANRQYWEKKAGGSLLNICDECIQTINNAASSPKEFNYLRGYLGLRSNGLVKNFISFHPKRTKNFIHIVFRNENAATWKDSFEEAGVRVQSRHKGRVRITVTPSEFKEHADIIQKAIIDTVNKFEGKTA